MLYKPDISIAIGELRDEVIQIKNNEILSISIMNNYDTATFPVIRLRLQCDVEVLELLTKDPDNLYVIGTLESGLYDINNDIDKESTSPILVGYGSSISFSMKLYIESKNTPVNEFDRYENGLLKDNTTVGNPKVPLQLYCYDENIIHASQIKCNSIYKDISLETLIHSMCNSVNIPLNMDKLSNAKKYDQILIPNLNLMDGLSFLDNKYGLYEKGASVYSTPFYRNSELCIMNTSSDIFERVFPIYVEDIRSTSDQCGIRVINNQHMYDVPFSGVSVITETDIDRVLNSEHISAINVNTLNVDTAQLKSLFENSKNNKGLIETPNILHKNVNEYIASSYVARVTEGMTKIDVSSSGWPIEFSPRDRFNVVFESNMRGINIDSLYRMAFMNVVLANTGTDLFTPSTTMRLIKN